MTADSLAWIAVAVSAVSAFGGLGALLHFNHSRNVERDRDRDRMSRLESEVEHLRTDLRDEKDSINSHLDRIYAKLEELVKAIYTLQGRN